MNKAIFWELIFLQVTLLERLEYHNLQFGAIFMVNIKQKINLYGDIKMKIVIINSGSRSNGYLLEAENGDQLLIEAGCRLRDYQEVGHLKISRARGMLISHEHG